MPGPRRYFVLNEPLPASEISSLLGRVVADKVQPTREYAPFSPNTNSPEPPHNPADIIPDILPEPLTWTDRKEFFSQTKDWSIQGGLADLLAVEQSFERGKGIRLDSAEVKSYSLSGTVRCFQSLMDNEHYARDVHELLKQTRRGYAYFVVGFLTTKDTLLSEFNVHSRKSKLEITAPIMAPLGSPLPILGDPQIAPGFGASEHQTRSMKIEEEVVFAVAYDVIKSSRSWDREARFFMKKSLVNSGAKRAKAKHLAFAGGESDEDKDDSGSEDDDVIVDSDEENLQGKPQERETEEEDEGLLFVDTQEFPSHMANPPEEDLTAFQLAQ